jgi:hypothetical protein
MYGRLLIYWKLKLDTCGASKIKKKLRGGEREDISSLSYGR